MFQSPTFWVAVAFVVFVVAVFRPIKKSLIGALDSRAEAIKRQLDDAQELREEAQRTLAEYKRMQRNAAKEADEILESAKHEAATLLQQAEKDLEAQLSRREQLALEKIAQAEASAIEDVRNQAVDVAIAATARLLSENLDQARAEALVDAAIRELPEKLN